MREDMFIQTAVTWRFGDMADAAMVLLTDLTQPGRPGEGRNGPQARRSCGPCAVWRQATLRAAGVLSMIPASRLFQLYPPPPAPALRRAHAGDPL